MYMNLAAHWPSEMKELLGIQEPHVSDEGDEEEEEEEDEDEEEEEEEEQEKKKRKKVSRNLHFIRCIFTPIQYAYYTSRFTLYSVHFNNHRYNARRRMQKRNARTMTVMRKRTKRRRKTRKPRKRSKRRKRGKR